LARTGSAHQGAGPGFPGATDGPTRNTVQCKSPCRSKPEHDLWVAGAAGLFGSSPNHPRTTEVDMSSVQASSESLSDGRPDAVADVSRAPARSQRAQPRAGGQMAEAVTSSATVLVSRRESFNAAHQLCDPGLSDEENQRIFGKCANLHGHNYVLEVVMAGQVDQATGYVFDLKQLSDVISRRVIQDVDHRNLNTDVPWLEGRIPTAENLAVAFWERIRSELPEGMLRSVRLWETDKNWAEVVDPV
jgi:6-pyruvoyltetrahydropterin/6-carboxytetrahydropterin synthase